MFSFNPVKIITSGEGGMAVTNNEKYAHKIRRLRSHGITKIAEEMESGHDKPWHYEQKELGFNYRMTDIQAALGNSQARRLKWIIEKRNDLLNNYKELIMENNTPIRLLSQSKNVISAVHLAVVQLKEDFKDKHLLLFKELRRKNIGVQLHYEPVHLQPYYREKGFKENDFTNAEEYAKKSFSIPLYPELTRREQAMVIQIINNILT